MRERDATMIEVTGKRERRFRWRFLRFEWGFWTYYTIPEIGWAHREWTWDQQ